MSPDMALFRAYVRRTHYAYDLVSSDIRQRTGTRRISFASKVGPRYTKRSTALASASQRSGPLLRRPGQQCDRLDGHLMRRSSACRTHCLRNAIAHRTGSAAVRRDFQTQRLQPSATAHGPTPQRDPSAAPGPPQSASPPAATPRRTPQAECLWLHQATPGPARVLEPSTVGRPAPSGLNKGSDVVAH
jgi:hypothetical protein